MGHQQPGGEQLEEQSVGKRKGCWKEQVEQKEGLKKKGGFEEQVEEQEDVKKEWCLKEEGGCREGVHQGTYGMPCRNSICMGL